MTYSSERMDALLTEYCRIGPRWSSADTARIAAAALIAAVVWFSGCNDDPVKVGSGGEAGFVPDRPDIPEQGDDPAAYTGDDPLVLESIERFRTGNDLHKKVIVRTCSPNGGVCHNQQEYPDLRTPANFLDAINAPCNVAPGDWTSVDDRCEQPGDRFHLTEISGREIEIGYVEHIGGVSTDYRSEEEEPQPDSTGLHIHLRDPVDTDRSEVWSDAQFVRTFVNEEGIVEDLPYATFTTRWWILGDGDHLFGEVRSYHTDQVNELMSVGIVQGDLNRNGIFGASESTPHSLIEPGDPEQSYLIGRMRGSMGGEPVPGSRMPLANQPLTIPEMLALFCFIEGLPEDGSWPNMNTAIDYADCSYSEEPEELNLLGDGVTWEGRVSKIFEANCSGCHGGSNPDEGLDLRSEDAYDNLFEPSVQQPEMQLVEPGEPAESYLWLKLIDDPFIDGSPMPFNPLTGEGSLREAELGDIETWIVNGAIRDE